MKLFLVLFFSTLLISLVFPYWVSFVVSFLLGAFMASSKKEAILMSGLAVSLAWLSMSIFQLTRASNSSLVSKMGSLFVGVDNIFGIYFIYSAMVFLAFIIGALSGYSGFQFRKIFQ